MNGPFREGSNTAAGGILPRTGRRRRKVAAVAATVLCLAFLFAATPASPAGSPDADTRSFEQRAAAEQTSRYRFRRLEVASLVLILLCGGAVVWWTFRRK